jgi:uncharacterized protein YbjT (DUF2867 family)
MAQVFLTGGTGYMGSRLIPLLVSRGHQVRALTRKGSEAKLPPGCEIVFGNALSGESYAQDVAGSDTFVQLVGVAHPGPSKAKQFVEIDQTSGLGAVAAAKQAGIQHFVYVSVAHPAPAMQDYIAARTRCEEALLASGLNATILRPWYVLGPGHRWPYALVPFYWLARQLPSTREGAVRLGLVTLPQMLNALVVAVENPSAGVKVVGVPEIVGRSSQVVPVLTAS